MSFFAAYTKCCYAECLILSVALPNQSPFYGEKSFRALTPEMDHHDSVSRKKCVFLCILENYLANMFVHYLPSLLLFLLCNVNYQK